MLAILDSLESASTDLSTKAKGNDKDAKRHFDLVNRALVFYIARRQTGPVSRRKPEEIALRMLRPSHSKPVLYSFATSRKVPAATGKKFAQPFLRRAPRRRPSSPDHLAKIEIGVGRWSLEELTELCHRPPLGHERRRNGGWRRTRLSVGYGGRAAHICVTAVSPISPRRRREGPSWPLAAAPRPARGARTRHAVDCTTDFEDMAFIRAETSPMPITSPLALSRLPALPELRLKARNMSSPTVTVLHFRFQ